MPNTAFISTARTSIPLLDAVIDGAPTTTHLLSLDKSDEPLEDGTSVTDHAVALPESLRITGWISDMAGGGRPGAAWAEIRRLNRTKALLTVTTEWGQYNEMLLQRVEGFQDGRGCRFEMQLGEIIRVGNPQAALPPGTTSGPAAGRPGTTATGRKPVSNPS